MKLVHLSDLHLGKKFHRYDLEEDQRVIMGQIQGYIQEEKPDAVLLAGDVYDVGHHPPAWAVSLFGEFLLFLYEMKPRPEVFIIAGNHDSAERLAYASELFQQMGIHISSAFTGSVEVVTVPKAGMEDVCFYLFPYVQPYQCGKDEAGNPWDSYDEAVGAMLDALVLDPDKRHIMMTHQYVDDVAEEGGMAQLRESERYVRGGTEVVSVERFADFEYVALGHLHAPQWVKYKHVRYCGTPLAYSLSEEKDVKSLTVVEIGEKVASGERASVEVRELPLDEAIRGVHVLQGMSEDLLEVDNYSDFRDEYVHVKLEDTERVIGMAEALRKRFPYLLGFEYVNIRPVGMKKQILCENMEEVMPLGMFEAFYGQQESEDLGEDTVLATLSAHQQKYLEDLIAGIWGGEE